MTRARRAGRTPATLRRAGLAGAVTVAVCAATFGGIQAAVASPGPSGGSPGSAGATQMRPIAPDAPRTKTVAWLLSQLTVDEKLQFIRGGTDPNPHGEAGFILGVARLGIPDIRHTDAQGVNLYADATAYPGRLGLAASFDRTALTTFGTSVGTEGRALDVDLLYGPQVDLARLPTWVRNMTTYGEDPYLAAQLTAREIDAIQSTGLMSQVKHFSFYNGQDQDTPSIVQDQAAHELYLQASEAAVKDAGVTSVMCSYAKFQIAGVETQPNYACENGGALQGILKGQWGFKGWVTSDYTGSHATSDLLTGMDQEFASSNLTPEKVKPLIDPTSPTYDKRYAAAVDDSVTRIVYQYERFGLLDDSSYPAAAKTTVPAISPAPTSLDKQAGITTARRLTDETAVLLKNAHSVLPLAPSAKNTVAVIGPTADLMPVAPNGERARGFGDRNMISPLDALRTQAGSRAVSYAPGVDRIGTTVPTSALRVAPGGAVGLTRTETDATGAVVGTRVDATLDGTQQDLVKGHSYTWTGYVQTPAADTYTLWLQRPAGTVVGTAGSFNMGINPGLQQGGGRGVTANSTLAVDGVAQTLTAPSTILQNTYPGGPTVNGQYLGLDNGGSDVVLSAGLHKVTLTYAPVANTAATPTFRFAWAPQQANIAAAVAAAKKATTAVVFVDDANTTTTPGNVSTLGPNQDALVEAVAAANPRTVVVLNTDGAVQMPWLGSVGSVLEMWYPGQEGGSATADVLLGTYDPAGKLPLTFPTGNDATPFAGHPERAVGVNGAITWSEDMQMGYRWYDSNAVAPLFPFGYGLSYTSFEYSRLSVTANRHDGGFDVAFTVHNTGAKAGSDVPQVYVGPASSVPADVQQVPKKLLQFARVTLRPRQSTQVRVHVAPRDLSNWSTATQGWVLGTGDRAVYVAASATDIRLTGHATVVARQ